MPVARIKHREWFNHETNEINHSYNENFDELNIIINVYNKEKDYNIYNDFFHGKADSYPLSQISIYKMTPKQREDLVKDYSNPDYIDNTDNEEILLFCKLIDNLDVYIYKIY